MKQMTFTKTLFAIFFALALLLGALVPTTPAFAQSASQGVVSVDKLNFRAGPGFDQEILRVLERGQVLYILRSTSDGSWLNVQLPNGLQGWVYSLFVHGSPTTPASPAQGVVNAEQLRLRLGPGTGYSIVRLLSQGDVLDLIGRSANSQWLVVRTSDGTAGWVSADYITTSADIEDLPMREAYGGPVNPSQPGVTPVYSVSVDIQDAVATVYVNNFPESRAIMVTLSNTEGSKEMLVATGKTDEDGSATLEFDMPRRWSNGKLINEMELVVEVSLADGSYSRSASIVYYR